MQHQTKILLAAVPVALALATATGSAAYFRSRAEALKRENEATQRKVRTLEQKFEELQAVRPEPAYAQSALQRTAQTPAAGDEARIVALQARVAELEAALLERDRIIAEQQSRSTNRVGRGRGGPGGPFRNFTTWLDDLRRTDPQRYEEIMREREERRQRVSEAFAKQATHFLARDTSRMTEEEKSQYNRMLDLLNQTWALSEQLRTDPPPEDGGTIMRTIWQNMQELGPLLETERQREFMDLALSIGYGPKEAAEFVAYLNQILEATSTRSLFPGMPGGPRGFRGGGRGQGERNQSQQRDAQRP